MNKRNRCPRCNYDLSSELKPKDIREVVSNLNEEIRRWVYKVVSKRSKYEDIQQETIEWFLRSIEEVDQRVLLDALADYSFNHYASKPIRWLRAVVLNKNRELNERKSDEARRIGINPPTVKY